MPQYVRFMARDYSNEPTSFTLYLQDITPANFANVAGWVVNIEAAVEAITTVTSWGDFDVISEVYNDVATLPTSPYAQREQRAIFECVDSVTGRPFVIGVPCPDLGDMGVPGSDAINLSNVEVAAYIAVLQSDAVSPEGNAFVVVKGKIIGVSN
jgi:hypothetical protein